MKRKKGDKKKKVILEQDDLAALEQMAGGGDASGEEAAPEEPAAPDAGGEEAPAEDATEEKPEEATEEEPEDSASNELAADSLKKQIESSIPNKKYDEITISDVVKFFSEQKNEETGGKKYSIEPDETGLKVLFGEIGVDDSNKKLAELESEYKASGQDMWKMVIDNLDRIKVAPSDNISDSIVRDVLNILCSKIK